MARTLLVAIAAIFAGVFWFRERESANQSTAEPVSSAEAFARTYLDVVAGKPLDQKRNCRACHEGRGDFDRAAWKSLSARGKLPAEDWAAAVQLEARCGSCHVTPDPRTLPSESWSEAIYRMDHIMDQKGVPRLSAEDPRDIIHYYYAFSPDHLPPLAPDPAAGRSALQFTARTLGNGIRTNSTERPFIGHIQVTDLDRDGRSEVLICDSDNSSLNCVRERSAAAEMGQGGGAILSPSWDEEPLARIPGPARAETFTNRSTGRIDIVVACQERMAPTDELIGSVVLLRNEGVNGLQRSNALRFTPVTIATNLPRVAAVEPGDFNGDGEIDFTVAAFGHITVGEIGLLKARDGSFSYGTIVKRSGAIRARPVDLDRDGDLDFVALFGQEHEQISAFLNDGKGSFREVTLFKAATPSFGSSGLEVVDLDQDGDIDILFTNGDNMDLERRIPRPYHGLQWLENRGELHFVYRDILRLYGAYCAIASDLDKDGDFDVIVASLFNDWNDPTRASLLWLENDGRQQFTGHTIGYAPIQLISAAAADLNGDSFPDLLTSGMHIFPPYDRIGRITLWINAGLKNR